MAFAAARISTETKRETITAVVDVDERRHAAFQKAMPSGSKAQMFTDYRRMFDKMKDQIDAVFVAAPNHHHALASMMAMQLGKGVYCEKPLCHDIAEARRLAETSLKCKVPTQMGAQGHCDNGYRLLCEYVWSGALGKVTETHSWTDRSNGGKGPRPPVLPVPASLHWDEWIGPAPFRDYHADLHPHEFHGWYDFGNGSLGNMACHVLDGPFWSLKIEHPLSVEAEEVFGGTDERCPTGTRIRWDIAARGDMPPVKVYWYDGRKERAGHAALRSSSRRCWRNCGRSTPARSSTPAGRSTSVRRGSSPPTATAATHTWFPGRR